VGRCPNATRAHGSVRPVKFLAVIGVLALPVFAYWAWEALVWLIRLLKELTQK